MLSCILLIWIFNVNNFTPEIWTQYDSPLIALLAASIFALFITKEWQSTRKLWELDRLCFGVYLIHPLFIQFTYRVLRITPIKFPLYPVMAVLIAMFFTCLAFGATWIIRKIPIMKKYIL